MPIEWRDATVSGFGIFVAIAGGSTSGKTFTALRLGMGLKAPGTHTFVCDTEGGRTLHYAKEFQFKHFDMRAPFSAPRFLEVARDAEAAGAGVLIFDNFSLEWIGEGGVHSTFDTLVAEQIERARRRQDEHRSDDQLRMAYAQAVWARVKPPHKAMMSGLLQLRTPIIFVLRAEEKTKPGKNGVPENVGWQPIQDKRFIFEWTVSITLHPETPGMPRYDLPHKIEGQHRALFRDGELIGEAAGEGLRAWARSGAVALSTGGDAAKGANPPPTDVERKGRQAAEAFVAELLEQLETMTTEQMTRHLVGKKVKARTDRLVDAHPDLSERIDEFVNSRMQKLDTEADAQRDRDKGKGVADQQVKEQAGNATAEPDKAPDPRAESDAKFEAEMVLTIGTVGLNDIDGLLEQGAVRSTLRRMEKERPKAHARIMAAVKARKAPEAT